MMATERSRGPRVAQDHAGAGPLVLVCTTTRECPRTLAAALDTAREAGRELLAIFILDPALLAATASLLSRAGFDANERAASDLEPEYRARAEARLQEIATAAGSAGISVRTKLCEGDFAGVLSAVLLEEGAFGVVCARKKRSHYARLIFEHRLLESVRDTVPVDEVEET